MLKMKRSGTRACASASRGWSLPTALAFLAWFVFAPQCISTIAVVRRETNGWKWPIFMIVYLFAMAYLAAGATFWLATALRILGEVVVAGSVNKVILIGNLGKDPEARRMNNGGEVVSFTTRHLRKLERQAIGRKAQTRPNGIMS